MIMTMLKMMTVIKIMMDCDEYDDDTNGYDGD